MIPLQHIIRPSVLGTKSLVVEIMPILQMIDSNCLSNAQASMRTILLSNSLVVVSLFVVTKRTISA